MTNNSTEIALCSENSRSGRQAVILFHGMTGTPREMQELAESLHSSDFDCFVPRLSGHDRTIEQLAQTQLEDWLNDATNLLSNCSEYSKVHVIGQSFGALLALYLASSYPDKVSSSVLLSLPWKFRSNFEETILAFLSYLPTDLLNKLGYRKKKHRDGVNFRRARHAYTSHSIAAAARVVKLRREVASQLSNIKSPILLFHDPLDHHLSPESVTRFRKECSAQVVVESKWMYGGYHELTLGPHYQRILTMIQLFLDRAK